VRLNSLSSKIHGFLLSLVVFAFSSAQAATLIHSNDVFGDIEPCGCRSNPQGGVTRKENMMKRLNDPALIQVDAGDVLFSATEYPKMLAEQAELQASYLIKAMNLSGHDVVVPGEKDFALGLKTFEKLIKKSKAQFLAANLVRVSDKKPLLKGHAVLEKKGTDGAKTRVCVLGVVGESLTWPKGLRVTPAIPAARKEIAALKGKCDTVIAVTHQGIEADLALAKQVPGIDVIVGGHSQSFLQTPAKVGSTVIVQSSFRNQYVGVMPLAKPYDLTQYRLVGLDAGYESPQDQLSDMDRLVVEFKKAVADLNTHQQTELTAAVSPTGKEKKFQTFPQCATCHMKQFDFWRKTNHAQAYDSLVQKKQEKNKECLTCHTVGLGDPQGFQNVAALAEVMKSAQSEKTESLSGEELNDFLKQMSKRPLPQALQSISRAWTPVQCENCHQPGGNHPFSGQYTKKVEKNVCLHCHTAERAPGWYTSSGQPNWDVIDAKRSQITCPTGELDETEN
jgi:5'-nucleotidase